MIFFANKRFKKKKQKPAERWDQLVGRGESGGTVKIPPWHKLWHTEPWEGRDNASNLLFLEVIPKGKLSWMDGAKHKELGGKNIQDQKKKKKPSEKSSESLYLLCWGKFLGFLRPGRIMQLQLWLLKPIPKFQNNSCWKDKAFSMGWFHPAGNPPRAGQIWIVLEPLPPPVFLGEHTGILRLGYIPIFLSQQGLDN